MTVCGALAPTHPPHVKRGCVVEVSFPLHSTSCLSTRTHTFLPSLALSLSRRVSPRARPSPSSAHPAVRPPRRSTVRPCRRSAVRLPVRPVPLLPGCSAAWSPARPLRRLAVPPFGCLAVRLGLRLPIRSAIPSFCRSAARPLVLWLLSHSAAPPVRLPVCLAAQLLACPAARPLHRTIGLPFGFPSVLLPGCLPARSPVRSTARPSSSSAARRSST